MKIEIAKKLIMVLLVILVISIGLTLFLIKKSEDANRPADTGASSGESSTSDVPPETDETSDSEDPMGTTTPPVTDSDLPPLVTLPPVTTEPPITTEPPVTTTPPDDQPPSAPKAPAGFSLEKSFSTDTGVKLNIIAECVATRNSDGSVNLTVSLYLAHHALGMGPRNCVLTVGNVTQKFTTERIKQDNNKATKALLQTVSGTFAYGETVEIYAKVPVGLTNYGGVEIKTLTIDTSLTLE